MIAHSHIHNAGKMLHAGSLVVESSLSQLPEKIADIEIIPTLVCAYASPFLDIDSIAQILTTRFPDTPLMIGTTAGELHVHGEQLYCSTGNYWDRIVVQCFDNSLICQAEVVSVALGSEDLQQDRIEITLEERVSLLEEKIKALDVSMDIDYRDTLAFVMFDGLSSSESFFMEALYHTGRFPCLFVGGSAGSLSAVSQKTWLHNGQRKLAGHALIGFLKTAPGIRFGIMKSQNFELTETSFSILSASVERRYIHQVVDKSGRIVSLIDALCTTFACQPDELSEAMTDYSFAISIAGELFIRSVLEVDLEMDLIRFYCDISSGEELLLVRKTDLVQSTQRDFQKFLQNKPGLPVAGILNDCLLRRLLNKHDLAEMGNVLQGCAIAGYSTFGEVLGLYLNQTLTGIFFFEVPEGFYFKDEYIDNFIYYYSEFKSFFLRRQLAKLTGLSQLVAKQLTDFTKKKYDSTLDSSNVDQAMGIVFDELNVLGKTLHDADLSRQLHASQIEEQLRDSEERFRVLAESSLTGIYLIQDGRFRYINESFARMFGYEPDEIPDNIDMSALCAPEDRDRVREMVHKREVGEMLSARYQFKGLRKNGTTFYLEVHGRRTNFRGKVGVIGTLIDITEQKKIEAELRASEERYRALYNETPSMFFTIDSNSIITAVNDFCTHQLGYSKAELVGSNYLNLFHGHDRDKAREKISACLQAPGKICHWQFRKVRKNGSPIWSEEVARALPGEDGQLSLIVVCQDISERMKLEESLKLAHFIFDKASVGIFLLDDHSRILDVNEHGCKSLDYSKDELLTMSVDDFDPNSLNSRKILSVLQTVNEGKSITFKSVHRKRNGSEFPVQIFVSPLPNDDRNLRVAFVQDISESEKAQQEQEKLEKQLKQVQKLEAIGRLAGGIAHDLNNLLTPVLGYAELLYFDNNFDTSAKEKLSQISKAATGARDLVKQLLAFSSKQVLEYQPVNINLIIDDFEGLIRRTVRENIEISIFKASDMMPVLADQGQIKQVLLNLIVNASDAMPQGGKLKIETRLTELDSSHAFSPPETEPGLYATLEITDTGEGMDEETMSMIFEPFFSTKGELGTGLGLATVYGIIKQHQGAIQVDSVINRGSTFRILLPISHELHYPKAYDERKRPTILKGSETILLVEDNEAVRRTIQDILQGKGYLVIAARSGEEAFEKIVSGPEPDLLLTDLVMAGINGRELFEKLADVFSGLKVLYMSGYTDDIIVRHGVLEEQTQFIQKPFSSLNILQKVREVLDN